MCVCVCVCVCVGVWVCGRGDKNKRERSKGGKKEVKKGEEKVLRQDIGLELNLLCTKVVKETNATH